MLLLLLALALGGASSERLPDLVQRPPASIVLRDGRLAFTSQVDNVGDGPLEVSALRSNGMRADQVVSLRGGGVRVHEGVGHLRYVRSSDHQHWHLDGFERYELWQGGRLLVRDRKTGFCLYDRVHLGRTRAKPHYLRDCGRGDSRARKVVEGISPRFGDAYEPWLEGQSLDVRDLPPGIYTLVQRVNVGHLLHESRYDNDVARVRIRLTPTSVAVVD